MALRAELVFSLALVAFAVFIQLSEVKGTCEKLDSCTCRDSQTGKNVSLHSLARADGTPAFTVDIGYFVFNYNPCFPFTFGNCTDVAVCQTDQKGVHFNLGTQDSADFSNGTDFYNIVAYTSPAEPRLVRRSFVDLICNESFETANFQFIREYPEIHYNFRLTSKCACPGGCDGAHNETTCTEEGCGCRLKNGDLINIQSLDQPQTPLSAKGFGISAIFNPCTGVTVGSPDNNCKDTTSCVYRDGEYHDYGKPGTSFYDVTDGVISLNYRSEDGQRQTTVNLVCDESKRHYATLAILEQPTESQLKMELRSVCACPGRCTSPEPTCDGTDTCSCTLSDGSGRISLHNLDNPFAPIIAKFDSSATVYYNPCTSFTAPPPYAEKCKDVALCGESTPFGDGSLGVQAGVQFSVVNDQSPPEIALKYEGGTEGLMSIVILQCDETALVPRLEYRSFDGDHTVTLVLASKDACIVKDAQRRRTRL